MEAALAARLPDSTAVPTRLHQAMRYSVLGGGKRVRPMLLFASARTLGLAEAEVETAAMAVELVHSFSLLGAGRRLVLFFSAGQGFEAAMSILPALFLLVYSL